MRSFFGLNLNHIREIHKQFFYMKYYGGWSLFELYNLPIGLRNWYFEMLSTHKEEESSQFQEAANKNSDSKVPNFK